MTIPHLDALHPLCASPLSKEKVASSEANPTPLVLALVRQALQLVRSSEAWKRGKEYGSSAPRKGGKVLSLYCPSDMSGRLSKCAWHARLSRHNARDCGLDFADFYDGLGTDQHTTNEGQYIPGIIETKKVSSMVAGTAEIWRNSCESVPDSGLRSRGAMGFELTCRVLRIFILSKIFYRNSQQIENLPSWSSLCPCPRPLPPSPRRMKKSFCKVCPPP